MKKLSNRVREAYQAEVLLSVEGTGETPVRWRRWRWTIDHDPIEPSREDCVSVLNNCFSDPYVPRGYELVANYSVGNPECLWCETEGVIDGKTCELCEGDGYIYWGDEWGILVFQRKGTKQ